MEYAISFALALGINLLMFVPAYFFKTDKLTDISYGLSFIIVAMLLFWGSAQDLGHILLLLMIALWSARISLYLFIRIRKMKRDKRFDGMRENFFSFLKFWILQGVTVWVVLLSATAYFSVSGSTLTTFSYVGLFVWAVGLLIETIADYQKYTFINNEENKGKWIESGLWKYSRHPNYFGEITHWFGIFLFVVPVLSGASVGVAFLSPLYIAILIIFVSGIPKLEKGADKRWGDNPDYQTYKKQTSILIPLPRK